jgi:hypothetical protein
MKNTRFRCFYIPVGKANHSFASSQTRQRRVRWLGLIIAMGLAAWITISGKSIMAQQPTFQPAQILQSREYLVAESPSIPAENLTSPVSGSTPSEADMLRSMPIGKTPLKVSIGLHVSNLADINQASETFDVAGYLMYNWRDPRLAYQPQPNETSRASSFDKIWHPAIEMVNFKSSTSSDTLVNILPDGTVEAQERFSKTLSSGLTLQKFPFDRQSLQVVLESLQYDARSVKLIADSDRISIGTDSFVSLSEWQIGKLTGTNSQSFFPPEKQHYSRVTVAINVNRNSGFYVFKIMLPLLLITVTSWSVFWIDPQEFSAQIGIAFTNLLTIVALLLVINDTLPRVGYLTLMDGFTMICFLTIVVAVLVLIFAHRSTIKDNGNRAQKIHNLARWSVPATFVLLNIILFSSIHFI